MPPLPSFPFRIPALFCVLLALVCTQVPLLHTLGYEFSALTALLASLVSGFLTIRYISTAARTTEHPALPVLFRRALVNGFLLLLIPLAVMTVNAFFVKNCSLVDGLLFFLLLPVVSVWFSTCLGAFTALHYRHPRSVFLGLVVLSLLYVLGLGYWTPAVFSYNFFYGFFPGITYDEALAPDRTLLLFRGVTLFLGFILLRLAMLLAGNTLIGDSTVQKGKTLLRLLVTPERRVGSIATVAILAALFLYRGPLGFESPTGYVRDRLGGMYETPHMMIYYTPESFSPGEIERIGDEHEFRLHQIMDAFHLPSYGRISSYIYPSAGVKRRLVGTGNTNIAKPWSGEIHIDRNSLDATLKHELIHVVAAPFGVPVIGASLSTGLVEGLAMAVEWEWGNRTLHQYAAALRKSGRSTDIRGLMSFSGFASRNSSESYVLAGSFCRYLLDTYGVRNLTRVYRSGDFFAVYDRTLEGLITGWEAFLDGVPVSEQDREGVGALFLRPPVFLKTCARYIGERNREAGLLFGEKRFREASEIFGRSFAETGGYEALSGFVASAVRAGDVASVLAIYDTLVRRDPRPGRYLPLFAHFGLAAWSTGDTARARELFLRLEQADVLEDRTEAATVCRFALADSVNSEFLCRYFLAAATDSVRVILLDSMRQDPVRHWVPLYLKGRALARMGRSKEAIEVLGKINLAGETGYLEALRLKTIGECHFRNREWDAARTAFWTSLNFRREEVWQILVGEWIDRCEWSTLKNND